MAIMVLKTEPTEMEGLVSGKVYSLQNTGPSTMYIHEGASAPTSLGDAFRIGATDGVKVKKGAKKIYVWSNFAHGYGGGASVVYFEST